ncbi:V-type ATP synthase subunit E family protein [Methanoplanus endosymbiosus]|uniref:A-type ATP synthase subunit E n=1 Tax=Methanoplanus endosymbiosus TaxID=33865 RepID=A0A9E7PRK7_9EURY|nr:V-type ATP synthase subunit E family protein [Methanoplanus endosymbiosus]UUX93821.1 V-type ATP synthase subunit E family protein [Methanoplanus endosymbiosus]
MALDAVVSEIKAKGEKEAAAIIAEGKAESDKILAEANEKVISIKKAAESESDRQSALIVTREVAAANLSVKRGVLNAEKDLLDETYEKTVRAINELPADFHAKAARELCKAAAKELGEGLFYCNERDSAAVEAALSELKTLKGFSLAGRKDISGGVIAESADGQLQLDFSYNAYLSEVWEDSLKDASEALFG